MRHLANWALASSVLAWQAGVVSAHASSNAEPALPSLHALDAAADVSADAAFVARELLPPADGFPLLHELNVKPDFGDEDFYSEDYYNRPAAAEGPLSWIDQAILPIFWGNDIKFEIFVAISSSFPSGQGCGDSPPRIEFFTALDKVVWDGTSSITLRTQNYKSEQTEIHSVVLEPVSNCIALPPTIRPRQGESAFLGIISATVASVDDDFAVERVDPVGFSVYWNAFSQKITGVLNDPAPVDPVQDVVRAKDIGVQDPNTTLEDVLAALERDEQILADLLERVNRHRELANRLTEAGQPKESAPLTDCGSVHCVLSTLYRKGKECLHTIITKIKAVATSNDECSFMAASSPATRAKVLMDPGHRCNAKEKTRLEVIDETKPLLSSDLDSNASSAGSVDVDEAPRLQSFRTRHRFNVIVGSVLTFLCLGCFATFLHRRCCSPRARADRAARREEWRTRREYHHAACRQKWQTWWERHSFWRRCACCGGRKDRTADYEEKRAMILQQEQVLEDVMQSQIRHLQRTHRLRGETDAAEQGLAGDARAPRRSRSQPRHARHARPARSSTDGSTSDSGESLPSYRSRSSTGPTGRPPSYRTGSPAPSSSGAVVVAAPTTDVAHIQRRLFGRARPQVEASGLGSEPFPAFLPADLDAARLVRAGSPASAASDATPDSSVAALSPRGSFETLRTERSVV